MEILNNDEIEMIANLHGSKKVTNWSLIDRTDELIGFLGDHLNLNITIETCKEKELTLRFFIKCFPRLNPWKENYLRESRFFAKEYTMLNSLFTHFGGDEGPNKWRPKLLYLKKDVFVFEDVTAMGYSMMNHLQTYEINEMTAIVKSIARFHSQSYIFEERKTKEIGHSYRIWDEFSEYLQEPNNGKRWRNAGKNALIDFLKVHSKHNNKFDFNDRLEKVIPELFEKASTLMKPNPKYRNTVVHRDLWSNNMFIKNNDNSQVLIVDYQTVLYASPLLDLSSVIYFNTTKQFRSNYLNSILNLYYDTMKDELKSHSIEMSEFFTRSSFLDAYEESLVFAMVQASLIVPISVMTKQRKNEIFNNPDTSELVHEITRSKEFLETANIDKSYLIRVLELFDEIVEKYIYI